VQTNNNSIASETITFDQEQETKLSTDVDPAVNIMNTDGEILDYDAQYSSELDLLDDTEDVETFANKSKIFKKWAVAIEQEILIKKMELIEAETNEKKSI
jgi:hypothetical protein